MSGDDRNYLSLLTGAALAVLMMIVMFWIRSQIPDDVSTDILRVQTAAANNATVSSSDRPASRAAIASVYECVSDGLSTASAGPCGTAVLRQMVPQQHQSGDVGVVHR